MSLGTLNLKLSKPRLLRNSRISNFLQFCNIVKYVIFYQIIHVLMVKVDMLNILNR